MTGWTGDLRAAFRALLGRPASSVAAVLALATGVGASTFMFAVLHGAFGLSPAASDRVLTLRTVDPRQEASNRPVPLSDLESLADGLGVFDGVSAYRAEDAVLAREDGPVRISATRSTPGLLRLLGAEPVLGRDFTPADHAQGAPATVLLGHRLWRERFDASPDVLGRAVSLDGRPTTVIGVMPPGFAFPFDQEVWTPLRPAVWTGERADAPGVAVVVRLAPGVPADRAREALAAHADRLSRTLTTEEPVRYRLLTFVDASSPRQAAMIFGAMTAAALVVLLVACANVANLLLARGLARQQEAGVRAAVGAGRLRVALPFLLEAALVAGSAVVLGGLLAAWAIGRFDVLAAGLGKPYWIVFAFRPSTLAAAAGTGAFAALVAGALPALWVAGSDPATVLRGGRDGTAGRPGPLSRILVGAQVALACAVLVLAGLSGRSLLRLTGADFPYARDDVLTGRVTLPPDRYPDAGARTAWASEAVTRAEARPMVGRAAAATALPGFPLEPRRVGIDQLDPDPTRPALAYRVATTSGYFTALGTVLEAGRDFGPSDAAGPGEVAIVNRAFTRRVLGVDDPLGRRFRDGEGEEAVWRTVVGVAPDLRMQGFMSGRDGAGFYVPLSGEEESLVVVARSRGPDALAAAGALRGALEALDPELPLWRVRTMRAVVDESTWFFRLFGGLFLLFGATALFLAAVGLYGLLSFQVASRTVEMGLRMALGADRPRVLRLVLRGSLARAAVGAGVGLALAWLGSGAVAVVLYDVDPRDPLVFAAALAVVGAVTVLASLVPALRATRVDPVRALAGE